MFAKQQAALDLASSPIPLWFPPAHSKRMSSFRPLVPLRAFSHKKCWTYKIMHVFKCHQAVSQSQMHQVQLTWKEVLRSPAYQVTRPLCCFMTNDVTSFETRLSYFIVGFGQLITDSALRAVSFHLCRILLAQNSLMKSAARHRQGGRPRIPQSCFLVI